MLTFIKTNRIQQRSGPPKVGTGGRTWSKGTRIFEGLVAIMNLEFLEFWLEYLLYDRNIYYLNNFVILSWVLTIDYLLSNRVWDTVVSVVFFFGHYE